MPSIPVGTQATTSAAATVDFTCARCGHHATARVVGLGEGMQSYINAPGTAEARALADAQRDIARTLRRARCPKCGQRAPGALFGFLFPYLLIFVAFLFGGVIVGWLPTWLDMNMSPGDKHICTWVLPLFFGGICALALPLPLLLKWSSTDARVKWL